MAAMERAPRSILRWLFSSDEGWPDRLWPRWLVLRALGLIYFSAFYPLVFQIKGLIGPHGILPAAEFLHAVSRALGPERLWYAPTLLWLSSSSAMLIALCWVGMVASVLVVLNLWPRATLLVCFVSYLSFVTAAGDFSGYQSDGMLLEAGFIALFLAPRGFWPGLGADSPPSRASYLLLAWEWFRIYFESGLVKELSADPEWRHYTAMIDYYQNGPLPTWIGWYAAHLPHWFHWWTALGTLILELGLVWMAVMPRPVRLACFWITTLWQIGVILTANYTFINYLTLALGFLLLDDRHVGGFVNRFLPRRWRAPALAESSPPPQPPSRGHWAAVRLAISAVLLTWVGYATFAECAWLLWRAIPLPRAPVRALEPFRIANQYGLFAVMTRGRYLIEFQGSDDARNWTPYPYRYCPQKLDEAPRIYAPYQPRFDWNLWFASLGTWTQYPIVPRTEELLLANDPDVLGLFARNPFPQHPPKYVRAVLWQYWFTSAEQKRATGNWWRRSLLGIYAPAIGKTPDGRIEIIEEPTMYGPPE
jgi:hypothetical protein